MASRLADVEQISVFCWGENMGFGVRFCALALSVMLSTSLIVVADEEAQRGCYDGRGCSYRPKARAAIF